MTGIRKKAFVLIVLLELATLIAMIGGRMHLLRTGTPILLKCEPVDPRSLFSGDYVILNYTISRLNRDLTEKKWQALNHDRKKFNSNDTIYVAVKKNKQTGFWKAAAVSDSLAKLKKGHPVILRGRITDENRMQVSYGVEHYFVPQYEGKKIEQAIRDTSVEIVVSPSGETAIRKLFMYGKEVEFR